MTSSTHAVRPLALVAGGMILAVAACGSSGGQSAPTGSEPSATVATATETATATATQTATETATATATASSSGGTGGGTGLCATADLRVRYADDRGGAGAGSVAGTFTFTNAGSASCTLRGFPGVSYVTGDNGTQVGQAASRTEDSVTTKTLAAGKSVTAALRRSQPGNYGDDCEQTAVRGFRVYPPGSKDAVFVAFKTTGCKSTAAPLLQVGPVS